MEGMLEKKGGGSTTFGRRNWKKRYFILQDNELAYYDTYDKERDIPMSLKGTIDLVGSTVKRSDAHRDRKFVFEVKPKDGKSVLLCTEDDKPLHLWMKALKLAALGPIDPNELYGRLGLNPEEPVTMDRLAQSYLAQSKNLRKDLHSDKLKLKKLQEAGQFLKSNLEEEEARNTSDVLRFSAIISKGMVGIGFGMLLSEDPNLRQITVEEVMPTMRLVFLDEVAEGSLQKGDILVSVGANEDVTAWNLLRLKQRLAEFRVPVNTDVIFTFERRIPLPGTEKVEWKYTYFHHVLITFLVFIMPL